MDLYTQALMPDKRLAQSKVIEPAKTHAGLGKKRSACKCFILVGIDTTGPEPIGFRLVAANSGLRFHMSRR